MAYGDDDMSVLGSYLDVYSAADLLPANLQGGGFRAVAPPRRAPQRALDAVIAPAAKQHYFNSAVIWVSRLQKALKPLVGTRVTTRGLDEQTHRSWDDYTRIFNEPEPVLVPVKGSENSGLWSRKVYISKEALARLEDRAKAAVKKPAPKRAPTPAAGTMTASTDNIQKITIALGADPKNITDGKFGPTTKAKWQAAATAKGLPTTITGRLGARQVSVSRIAFTTLRDAAVAAAPTPAADIVINTGEAQGIMKRLGAEDPRLDDGDYGPTTAGYWKQSAEKRGLDPFMAKKTADLKTVTVRKATYLQLKIDADARRPPVTPEPVGARLLLLPPDQTTKVSGALLTDVIARLTGKTGAVQLFEAYAKIASGMGVDPRIENVDPKTAIVLKSAWTVVMAQYNKMAPPPPPGPPSMQQNIQAAMGVLAREATSSVSISTVKTAFNVAIQAGILKLEPFKPGPWESGMAQPLITIAEPRDEVWKAAWEQSLVPGKLVSADTVKMLPNMAKELKRLAALYKKEKKEAREILAGYTEVNPAEVIKNINALSVTTVVFDASGGGAELANAAKTFLQETKTPVPGGVLVRFSADKTKVYLKTSVLTALAAEAKAVRARAAATKTFRDKMVADALRSSTGKVAVRDFQQATMHIVLGQTLPPGAPDAPTIRVSERVLKIFRPVRLTGAFDKVTRVAYTEVSRTATIGPAVQEFQKLLRAQMGPKFQAALVVEARNQVWNKFLEQAVGPQNGSLMIKTLPSLASQIEIGSVAYQKNVSLGARRQEEVAAQMKVLKDAVKKSTAIVSVLDVQQALLQMASGASTTKVSPTGVTLSGRGDKATRDGLLQIADTIFPTGYVLPETMWVRYLTDVGIQVVSAQQVKKVWAGANYVGLPPAVADIISKNAGDWISQHGQAAVAGDLAPLPLANEELRLRFRPPTLVTARIKKAPPREVVAEERPEMPPPRDAQEAAAQEAAAREAAAREAAARAAEEAAARKVAEANAAAAAAAQAEQRAAAMEQRSQQAPQDAQVRQEADIAQQEAQAAQEVSTQTSQEAQEAQARVEVTGPTIQITTPAPVKAGMGGGMLLAGGLGLVALLALLARGDNAEGT